MCTRAHALQRFARREIPPKPNHVANVYQFQRCLQLWAGISNTSPLAIGPYHANHQYGRISKPEASCGGTAS